MNIHENGDGRDERFTRDVGRLLRESVDELDAATLSRLNRARQNALAEYERRGEFWGQFTFPAIRSRISKLSPKFPALGAAAVCATALIAVALWVGRVPGPASPGAMTPPAATEAAAPEDLDVVLVGDESLDMIENLEFYDWVDSDLPLEEAADPGLPG